MTSSHRTASDQNRTSFADTVAALEAALSFHEALELDMPAEIAAASSDAVDAAAWRAIETPAASMVEIVRKLAVARDNTMVGTDEAEVPATAADCRRIAAAIRADLDRLYPSA